MSEDVWYTDGLKFACTQCGDCCTGAPGYVWVTQEEIANLAAQTAMEVALFEREYVRKVGIRKSLREFPNGDCVFFDGQVRTCRVYAARPRQCRTWPFWDSNLRTPTTWQQTAEVCPGCNRGRVHLVEEIERLRGVVRV